MSSVWSRTRDVFIDTAALLRLRAAMLQGHHVRYARAGIGGIVMIVVLAAWLPAYLPDGEPSRLDVAALIPSLCLGVLALAAIGAAMSGGGRELLPREQAAAYPISTTVDHLGALVLAPLNVAWLLQSWLLLGAVAYAFGATWALLPIQVVTTLWILAATATAQLIAWIIEWIRRGRGGGQIVWSVALLLGCGAGWLTSSGRLGHLLDRSPLTRWVLVAQLDADNDRWLPWLRGAGESVALILTATLAGAWVAARVARRVPRDQVRLQVADHRPRANPRSDLGVLLRTDHLSVWRSVALRRGLVTLGVLPGGVALAGSMQWQSITLLPGLVCSGAALLFGVNMWCLDGTGALWRESQPTRPATALAARTLVLAGVLTLATALTLALASLRAGSPTAGEAVAVLAASVVAIVHVVASCLRWSLEMPYRADLDDARAVPAPPLAMMGYSARLALSTTVLALFFYATSQAAVSWSVMIALPLALLSGWRIAHSFTSWHDPAVRARVLSAVTG